MKKRMMDELRYPVLPYPKGVSSRYDTDNPVDLFGNVHAAKKKEVQ